MSQPSQPPPPPADDLQFATAETADGNAAVAADRKCVLCGQPIASTYYALGDQMMCPACRTQVTAPPEGSGFGRFVKAALFGLGAGLLGAVIWFTIRRVANLEAGLVAILVGFMVGKAVHYGSGARGGRGYQVLAVLLTYCCIAANYMPDIFEAVFSDAREEQGLKNEAAAREKGGDAKPNAVADTDVSKPAAKPADDNVADIGAGESVATMALLVMVVFALSLAAPFLMGIENLIGMLIIGFALWEAWKFAGHHPLPISGPYEVGNAPPAVT